MNPIKTTGGLLTLGLLASIAGLGAQQTGLEQAKDLPWMNLIYSFAAALFVFFLVCVIGRLTEDLNAGRKEWHKNLRNRLGVEEGAHIAEAVWMELMLQLALWCALGLGLLVLWGLSDTATALITKFANTGIKIGEARLVPGQVFLGIVVFTVLLTITRWIKNRLETRWLLRTPLEAPTRDAIGTLFGYITFVIIVLIGISVAGFELTNLAIVAGALGVGIGFGLQNIVSNLASGIILLFERPIRVGDYITVGTTEGFVRKTRIRATEIQTLDRHNIVVPNSEMLSNHVINWTLWDRFGRITAKVGVAYGSDTALVKELLLEVAKNSPHVIQQGNAFGVPAPEALFVSFGDSSLDFELKMHIRDIARRHPVLSEINLAVDKIFRENGVTIPFPQRDVWFKNPMQQQPATTMPEPQEPEPLEKGPSNIPSNEAED